MAVNLAVYQEILEELTPKNITLVAVSKTKPVADILELYEAGQRDFGENYVQELVAKQPLLPGDIRWHFIGHLQTNKVKSIAPFIHLIHSLDSIRLLKEVDKQATANNRTISCLLQVHIASEETKFGWSPAEVPAALSEIEKLSPKSVSIQGLMGMASLTAEESRIRQEFQELALLSEQQGHRYPKLKVLSMGMSSDYKIAIQAGSTLVRIGSLLFGERKYSV